VHSDDAAIWDELSGAGFCCHAQALLAGSLTALAPERSLLPCVPVALPSLVT